MFQTNYKLTEAALLSSFFVVDFGEVFISLAIFNKKYYLNVLEF